jgi:hypothetical protein
VNDRPVPFTDDELDLDDDWDEECEDPDDEFADWVDVPIGDGTTELMPPEQDWGFRDHVDVLARASGGAVSIGPTTLERREYICRFGDVYLVRYEGDLGSSNTIVGRGAGVAACVERSEAFVLGRDGTPCSAWSDEDLDGPIDEEELWDPDDESDSAVARPIPLPRHGGPRQPRWGCLVGPSGSRFVPRVSDERFSQEVRQENHERLWRTTIAHNGVVIAGDGASDELPANRIWYVIGCDEVEFDNLARVLGNVERATLQIDGRTVSAAFTDRLAATTAARVGAAFGNDEIWELERDAIRAIRTDGPTVVAQALRMR